VLDNGVGTGARVRVLIESTDGHRRWGTVGLSSNVVEASWQALVDSVEFKLHKDNVKPKIRPPALTNGARRVAKNRGIETVANGVAAKP
jgi:LeuA allosteric (dimerisation) domain